jgi:hypothetical protein
MGYSHGKCSFVILTNEKYKQPTVEYITRKPLSNARGSGSALFFRGGSSTKLHIRAEGQGKPLVLSVTGDERHDTITVELLM